MTSAPARREEGYGEPPPNYKCLKGMLMIRRFPRGISFIAKAARIH